jgi:hypothetical protein
MRLETLRQLAEILLVVKDAFLGLLFEAHAGGKSSKVHPHLQHTTAIKSYGKTM